MKLSQEEMTNYRCFSKMKGSVQSCKVNQINLSSANSREHGLIMLKKCLEIYSLGHNFITEACNRKYPEFRHDIVDLTTGTIYEAEVSSLNKNLKKLQNVVVIRE